MEIHQESTLGNVQNISRGIPKQTSEFQNKLPNSKTNFRIPRDSIHPVRLVSWKLNTLAFWRWTTITPIIILWRSVARQDLLGGYQLWKKSDSRLNSHTPLKINGWNISSWRFGSDHFPFFLWVICRFQPLIFHGVSGFEHYTLPETNIAA